MADMLARNWWILALRGVAAIIFGVLAWFWPDITLVVLVILFGAYVLVDGIFNLVTAALGRVRQSRWIVAVMGIAEIVIGIVTLASPDLTAIALVYLIAFWAATMGAFAMLVAYMLRREIEDEWVLGVTGALLILASVYLAISPGPGAIALVWLIGAFAAVYGVLHLTLALRLRNWQRLGGSTFGKDAARATSARVDASL